MSNSILGHLITVIAPVFLCAGAGYSLVRFKLPFDTKSITSVVTNVTMPALVISHLAAKHVEFSAFADLMLAAAIAVACMGIVASIILYALKLPLRVYSGAMMLSNVGNIGLPVCTLAFGTEGLAYALAFWIVVVVAVFTVGDWIPQGRLSFKKLVTSPSIYSVIIGLALMVTETPLPTILNDTLTLLGGATIPLMLLTLGYTIARLEPSNLPRGAMLAVLHIVIVGLIALIVSQLFGFTGTERGVFILQCLMPCSVFAYLMAERHMPERASEVASLVLISTALTVVVLPAALAFWV